jgi:hypothetical protein
LTADIAAFLEGLRHLAGCAWRIEQARNDGIGFVAWP